MGCGTSPCGSSPCGFGLPATSSASIATIGQVTPDGAASSIEIDSLSRDIVLDDNGSECAMGDTAQRVQLCLQTTRGSRLLSSTFGLEAPQAIVDNMTNVVSELVRLALDPVLADGSATLKSVVTEVSGTNVYAQVTWIDNRTAASVTSTMRLA